jgi:deazaflavin-dependent oxidoreductase (nitroreductase family)
MLLDLQKVADADVCSLTTRGRVSGRSHTIEIWFAIHGHILYVLSGAREQADWVKNILHFPAVQVKIKGTLFSGQARLVSEPEEDGLARTLLYDKYTPRSGDDLRDWSRSALPVAVHLTV